MAEIAEKAAKAGVISAQQAQPLKGERPAVDLDIYQGHKWALYHVDPAVLNDWKSDF